MARMLYWGSQGVQRDVSGALEYYRRGAESGDPSALYDYGIVLLKVRDAPLWTYIFEP